MARTDEGDTLSQNRVFDLLSNARRRFVLHYLNQQEGPIELRELADEVARWETGSESLTRKQRKRVYVSLYQTHIPRLADAGVVDYDPDTGLVELVDRARDIDRYISQPGDERPWPLYYVAIAVAGGGFYLLVVFDVLAFVPDIVAGVLVVAALLVVSVTHLVVSRRRRELVQVGADQTDARGER